MQATVTAYSGDKFGKRVTSHSLRYGGATMLAAAGLPHYIIAMYGGWSQDSQSLKLYTKPSTNMVNIVSRHMASMGNQDSSIYFINDAYVISQGGYRDEGM
jgi:integrase